MCMADRDCSLGEEWNLQTSNLRRVQKSNGLCSVLSDQRLNLENMIPATVHTVLSALYLCCHRKNWLHLEEKKHKKRQGLKCACS